VPGHVVRYEKVFFGLRIKFILYLGWHPVLGHANQFVSKMFARFRDVASPAGSVFFAFPAKFAAYCHIWSKFGAVD